jgi:hypothetical protein
MNQTDTPLAPALTKRGNWVFWLGWLCVLSSLAYFVVKNVPRYFVFTPESYGSYFWPKVSWLFPHVAGGLIAVILGPLQFWPKIRRDYLPFHRIAGRVYVVAVLIGAIASWGMAATASGGAAYALGLAGLGVAWVITTGMAFIAIRRKNLLQHKQWMVRSYVVTFAFVSFRLMSDLLSPLQLMDGTALDTTLAWACWAIPLLVTEVAIQSAAVFKGK